MKKPTIADLLARPAMNGGWAKLARQQSVQCRVQRKHGVRLRRIESRLERFDRAVHWILAAAGSVLITTAGRTVYDLAHHFMVH